MLLAEVPQLAALAGPGTAGPHELGVLRATPWPSPACSSSARMLVGLLVVVHRPSRAQPRHQAGQGLPAVRLPLLAAPGDRAPDQLKFFTTLFGDSSYIVHYLRWPRLRPVPGGADRVELRHGGQAREPVPDPVGSGTVVADGLSIINADYSSTSFRVSRTSIGAHNFLGNAIAYPAQGRTGDNCLLATKVMVPIDGAVREGVGLLGSPSFEIPRTVERDSRFADLRAGRAAPPARRQEQAQPRHHGAVPAGAVVLPLRGSPARLWRAADLYHVVRRRAVVVPAVIVLSLLFTVVYFVLGRAGLDRVPTRCGRSTARSTTPTSGGTSASGSWVREIVPRSSTAPRSRAWSGGCWVSGSAAGSSTTAAA